MALAACVSHFVRDDPAQGADSQDSLLSLSLSLSHSLCISLSCILSLSLALALSLSLLRTHTLFRTVHF